ncbi:hypothetical protein AGDE_04356 [Angomonas deanei]|nr:hypothetical protein AGDE_04356 [Angomonas deanei]|eukprot:EPY39572.1 hypothetical protein AGDE_04356 [Angomonas deanei]
MADMLSHCTDLWVTSCTPAVAVTRVMQRNQLPRKDAEQRVASQGGLKEMTEKIRKSGFDRQCVSIFETDHVTLEEGLAEVEQAFQPYFDKHFHKP